MDFLPINLEGFDGRESALAQIKRYTLCPIMFYRTNDFIHSRRVLWHLEESVPNILDLYQKNFDVNFARTLALVHDDIEILTGDVQLYYKERMNNDELEALAKKENDAIPRIIKMYNSIANNYDYRELLTNAKDKNRLEAQFVSFFDKFDAGGEAWHEVWAGNHYFVLHAGGNQGQKGGYVRRLNDFPEKYPAMAKFFEQFPQYLPRPFDFKSAAEKGKPYTGISLQKDSDYPPYERWKKTILEHEKIDALIAQLEFN
jgi:hypothetical protein